MQQLLLGSAGGVIFLSRATSVSGAQALPRRRPCGEGPERRTSHLRRGPEVHHVSWGVVEPTSLGTLDYAVAEHAASGPADN